MPKTFSTLTDLEVVDVIGFSMGPATTARLLMLPTPGKVCHSCWDWGLRHRRNCFGVSKEFWPVPDYLPRPLTTRGTGGWSGKNSEKGDIVPGHLASANLIAARVTGADREDPGGCSSTCSRAYFACRSIGKPTYRS
jgi:hypothetical protein